MYYTIYKIINTINNKYYIGKHQTKKLDDGYMGSGKYIKRAILTHGIQNFTKEILYIFDNEEEMNEKEKELVVICEQSYNLCDGGHGGFGYINRNNLNYTIEKNRRISLFGTPEFVSKYAYVRIVAGKKGREVANELYAKGIYSRAAFKGKHHSDVTKSEMSVNRKGTGIGNRNSQFGTCWITNGIENKKIKKEDFNKFLELGYSKGRN
jgi:hypothetical protein